MTVYLSNRDGDGKTNEEGHFRLLSQVLQGQVLGATHLQVLENTSPGMSIMVQLGDYRLETAPGEYAYMGWLNGVETVTITAADPTNPRISVIVLYVDKGATTAAVPPNNPGITKIVSVNGAAAGSPIAPSGAAIQTAVGSGNPYMVLAHVAVGASTSTITNSNITDMRTLIKLNDDVLSAGSILQAVGPLLYPIGSLYYNATNNTNPGTLLGFGTWAAFGQGRVPVGIDTADSDFGTPGNNVGAKTITLTEAQMPNHTHSISAPSVTTSANGDHTHRIPIYSGNSGHRAGGDISGANWPSNILSNQSTNSPGNHAHSVSIPAFTSGNKGNSQSHSNIQPSVVVYIWRRTA